MRSVAQRDHGDAVAALVGLARAPALDRGVTLHALADRRAQRTGAVTVHDEHDVVVLPSFTEGFPQVVLEAMVRGLAVVCTAVGGIPRVIRDGESGLLIPAGNAEALASALRRVLTDMELRGRLSRAGQCVARRYTREAQTLVIENFIRQSFPQVRLKNTC